MHHMWKLRLNLVKKEAAGESFLNTLVINLPFEMHLPGYNFTGHKGSVQWDGGRISPQAFKSCSKRVAEYDDARALWWKKTVQSMKCISQTIRRRHNWLCREIKRRCLVDKEKYIKTICTLPEQRPASIPSGQAYYQSQCSTRKSSEGQKRSHAHWIHAGQG